MAFSKCSNLEANVFLKDRNNIKLLEREQIIYHFKARDPQIPNI